MTYPDDWRPWFAWHPVRLVVCDDLVWLRYVERIACPYCGGYKYRRLNLEDYP